MNIKEFIENTENRTEISRVPTTSSRSTLAKKYVNEVLSEHPEWFNIISALVSFPVQTWASKVRNDLKITDASIKEVLEYGETTYFGIRSERNLKTQLKLNEQTKKMMLFMGSAIREMCLENKKYEVLSIVHGSCTKEISRYKFVETYKPALMEFCRRYNSGFNQLYKETEKDFEEMDTDCQFAFNNTELLLNLKRKLFFLDSENVVICDTLEKMNECIGSLDSYIINPEHLSQVMELYSEGKSEETIGTIIDRSRVYVRDRKREGIRALSYLIWGYSVKNIVNNLK